MSEKKIHPASAIVLGLNDALVELTGSLAGLSLALGSTNLIAISGIIIGFSGALSMTASEYLSAKEDQNKKRRAHIFATYTGLSYLGTVLILTAPYLIFNTVSTALGVMVCSSVGVIGLYAYYIQKVKRKAFTKTFFPMLCISMGVALLSFGIAYVVKQVLGVDV